jgi:hypothetical protein
MYICLYINCIKIDDKWWKWDIGWWILAGGYWMVDIGWWIDR